MEPHPEEVPLALGPDLLTVRKSGVSRTHSLPNDSYMCRDGSTAEGSLGRRSWGLPKAQSGTRAQAGLLGSHRETPSLPEPTPDLGGRGTEAAKAVSPNSKGPPRPPPARGEWLSIQGEGSAVRGEAPMGEGERKRGTGVRATPLTCQLLPLLLPSLPTGSVLSVHSQPADSSYILQLPKDTPHLLQPHSAPTWGTIPKLPPPGRSPLAQRPLRRQVSRCGEVGQGPGARLSAGNPGLLVTTRWPLFILPANVYRVLTAVRRQF